MSYRKTTRRKKNHRCDNSQNGQLIERARHGIDNSWDTTPHRHLSKLRNKTQ